MPFKSFHFLLIGILVILGCSNSIELEQHATDIGKVIIVKSKIFPDRKFHYGAFRINRIINGPEKWSNLESSLSYQWVFEQENTRKLGSAVITDREPITFGTDTSGVSEIGWNFRTKKSVYLHHIISDSEGSIQFCITNLSEFPDIKFSEIQCNYHSSKPLRT